MFNTNSNAMNSQNQFIFNGISSNNKLSSTSENIRERLNLHVKRRIQVQGKSSTCNQTSIPTMSPSSSSSSVSPSSSSILLNLGIDQLVPQNLSIDSNAITPDSAAATAAAKTAILFSNLTSGQSNAIITDRNKGLKKIKITPKKQSIKFVDNKKIVVRNTRIPNCHQINIISKQIQRNGGLSGSQSNSKPTTTLIEINTLPTGTTTTTTTHIAPEMQSISNQNYEKYDSKTINTPDILSIILNEKKNALMHDPEIKRFLTSMHMKSLLNGIENDETSTRRS